MSAPRRHSMIHLVDLRPLRDEEDASVSESASNDPPTLDYLESLYPGITEKLLRGDIIENLPETGNRSSGSFMVDLDQHGQPIIVDRYFEYDDYGSPPICFLGITEFPLDYWDSEEMAVTNWTNKPGASSEFYWHADSNPAVHVDAKALGLDHIKSTDYMQFIKIVDNYSDWYYKVFTYNDQNYLLLVSTCKGQGSRPIGPINCLFSWRINFNNPNYQPFKDVMKAHDIPIENVATDSC